MKYTCPVCGYGDLTDPPMDYEICPCCGTEFGYDDVTVTHEELRQRWLIAGAPWFDHTAPPPPNWNPNVQLDKAGYGFQPMSQEADRSSS
jgi:hypothetical protein